MLALDEPTDGLDRERVTALRTALKAWQESDDSRQLFIVTHDRALMGVFDKIIEL
jgi:DNA repair exonuclease SbcCD ATPase subunit